MTDFEQCDSLSKEQQIQLDACEENQSSLNARLDSSMLSGRIKDKVINLKTAEIVKIDHKRKQWMHLGGVLAAVFIVEKIINQITLKQ